MITCKTMRIFSFASLLVSGLALSAFAQDQTQDATDTEDAPSTEAPSIEDELSLGQDANQEPGAGTPYTAETFGDWELRCIRSEDGNDPCQMYQLLRDAADTPISEFSLFRLPEGGRAKAGATVVVPLETALQQQLTIAVDGGTARRYPYSYCTQLGCFARIGLTEGDVNAFKRGNAAKLTIVPVLAPDQKVEVSLSLTGFTAAYDKVSVIQQ